MTTFAEIETGRRLPPEVMARAGARFHPMSDHGAVVRCAVAIQWRDKNPSLAAGWDQWANEAREMV